MYENIYCVQIFDYRLPNLGKIVSTFITVDFEYEDCECGQTFYCEDYDEALEWVKRDYVKE